MARVFVTWETFSTCDSVAIVVIWASLSDDDLVSMDWAGNSAVPAILFVRPQPRFWKVLEDAFALPGFCFVYGGRGWLDSWMMVWRGQDGIPPPTSQCILFESFLFCFITFFLWSIMDGHSWRWDVGRGGPGILAGTKQSVSQMFGLLVLAHVLMV